VLRKSQIRVAVEAPDGLIVDGYPGSYGQILTNLFLNAATHAFSGSPENDIAIVVRPRGADEVEIRFTVNGAGMAPDVQRTCCRHQIRDGASRDAMHVARVLAASLDGQDLSSVTAKDAIHA